jgi:hypothetical protein
VLSAGVTSYAADLCVSDGNITRLQLDCKDCRMQNDVKKYHHTVGVV